MDRRVGPASEGRRWCARAGVAVVAGIPFGLIAMAVWTGCAVTEKNYRTLAFFFDGVPDPSQIVGPDGGPLGPGDPRRGATLFLHKPYAEDNCDACHQGRMRMSRRDSDVCLKCHAEERSGHEHMHGPVAAGECLWCHSPHESTYPALMKDADRVVCTTCHTAGLLSGARVPAHTDPSRRCLECHSGHGGKAPFMLLEGISPTWARESSGADARPASPGGER